MTDTITRPDADGLPLPDATECVLCYVARLLPSHGCDTTLRLVRRWRDARLPRAIGLERRFEARGGFCDCEVFMNGWTMQAAVDDDEWDDERRPLPPCPGVSPRSSQPCDLWEPRRRGRW